jgi:hypothetical protein
MSWLLQHPLAQAAALFSLFWWLWGWRSWWQAYRRRVYLGISLAWPLMLALLSPLVGLRGMYLGWQRFDRELIGLTALQPWEGLRGLQIVRHATHSFLQWSSPLVSAALMILLLALGLSLQHSFWRLTAYWRARRYQPERLALIEEKLVQVHELLVRLEQRLPASVDGDLARPS